MSPHAHTFDVVHLGGGGGGAGSGFATRWQLYVLATTHQTWLDWAKYSNDAGYRSLSRDDVAATAFNVYILLGSIALLTPCVDMCLCVRTWLERC